MVLNHSTLDSPKISVALAGAGQVGMNFLELVDLKSINLIFVATKRPRAIGTIPEKFRESTLWITSLSEISMNESVNVVIEAIDDTDAARQFILDCLTSGKTVISCSKDVWVKHLQEIVQTCQDFKDSGAKLILNSLTADNNGKSGYKDLFLDHDSISLVDINDVVQFRGADGRATAKVIVADLNAAQTQHAVKTTKDATIVKIMQSEFNTGIINNSVSVAPFIIEDDRPVLFLSGDCGSLYHSLFDEIGQALYLKQLLPELRVLAVYYDPEPGKLMQSLCKMFGFEIMKQRIPKYQQIKVKNLVWLRNPSNVWLKREMQKQKLKLPIFTEASWQNIVGPTLREAFKDKIIASESPNKKIFLQIPPGKWKDSGRNFLSKDVLMIEKFFKNKGYLIVDPMKIPFRDQVSLVANSTHLASLAGSNSAHSVYAKEDAIFVMINLSEKYGFAHSNVLRLNCDGRYIRGNIDLVMDSLRAMEEEL